MAVIVAAMAFVFWRGHIWEVDDAVRRVSLLVAIAVLALTTLLALPLALRENAILVRVGTRARLARVAPVAFYGNTISLVTPAAAGEVLRPRMLERLLGVPLPAAVAVVIYERFYSYAIFALTALTAFVLTVLPGELAALPLALLVALSLLTPRSYKLGRSMFSRTSRFLPAGISRAVEARLHPSMAEGDQYLATLTGSARLSLDFAIWTLLTQAVTVLQFWLICHAVTSELSLSESWSILILGTGAGMLSLLPLGLGAADAVMFALSTSYGASEPAAAAIVLLYRALIYLPTAVSALVAYVLVKRQERRTPGLQQEPSV